MIKAEKYITCRCGKKHSTTLYSIAIEKGATSKVADYITNICPCGRVLLVTSKGYDSVDIKTNLRRNDYIIEEITLSENLNRNNLILDDGISLIIGVGDISVNRAVKLYSYINKIPNVFVATELDDEIIQEYVSLNDNSLEQYKGDTPKIIIYDSSIEPTKEQIAYYISSLYFRLISLFDSLYAYKIYANMKCDCLIKETISIIRDFLGEDFDANKIEDIERLYKTIGLVMYNMSYIPINNDSYAETLLRLLRLKYKSKSIKITSAYAVDTLYRFWLINSISDISIPPNREYYYEKLAEIFNIDKFVSLKGIKFRNDYSLIDYIFKISREELLSCLLEAAPSTQRIMDNIKNIYSDKGYHLSELMDYKILMGYMALAGELSSEFSLIKHIDKSGLLWHYVDNL